MSDTRTEYAVRFDDDGFVLAEYNSPDIEVIRAQARGCIGSVTIVSRTVTTTDWHPVTEPTND